MPASLHVFTSRVLTASVLFGLCVVSWLATVAVMLRSFAHTTALGGLWLITAIAAFVTMSRHLKGGDFRKVLKVDDRASLNFAAASGVASIIAVLIITGDAVFFIIKESVPLTVFFGHPIDHVERTTDFLLANSLLFSASAATLCSLPPLWHLAIAAAIATVHTQ